jgi:hypothetical protein
MGIGTVAIHSRIDSDAYHMSFADQAYFVGKAWSQTIPVEGVPLLVHYVFLGELPSWVALALWVYAYLGLTFWLG